MKKPLLLFLGVFSLLLVSSTYAQETSSKYGWLAKDAWAFGFGGTYPKYISTNWYAGKGIENYGGYLSIQKNFSEHVGLRLKAGYLAIEADASVGGVDVPIENHVIFGDFDLLYYFIPCEPVSPYLGVGLGGVYYTPEDDSPLLLDTDDGTGEAGGHFDYQMNLLFGAEWRIGQNWKLKTEIGYHSPAASKFDGQYETRGGGLLGGQFDSYMTLDLGLMVYFGYGEKSNICDLYEGLARVDYNQIEEIVKRYAVQPTEVDYARIEDIVKRNRGGSSGVMMDTSWVLIGINFDFNKASLRPESIPILYEAASILMKNPDIRVEIVGHTDNIGSESYNQKLSERRAMAVKDFLMAKGVAGDRLTTVGAGETQPVIDNDTADHRFLNRRIEFKVTNR